VHNPRKLIVSRKEGLAGGNAETGNWPKGEGGEASKGRD